MLCHLQGKTHEEAARLLHWPVGTVSGRLSRGRELLRSRLKRRGVDVSPAVLAANWLAGTTTSVALPLIESIVGAALHVATAQAVSLSVLSLTQGVVNTMLLNKIKATALAVLLVGGMTAGVGVWAIQVSQTTTGAAQADKPAQPNDLRKAAIAARGAVPASASPMRKAFVSFPQEGSLGMGLSFPPTHLKNSPNTDARIDLPGIRTEFMVLVESPDRNGWQGMSLEFEKPSWSEMKLAPGTTAQPLAGDDVAALMIKGKKIDRIGAFTPYWNHWAMQTLREPVEDEINPVVGPGYALYQARNDFYAFTAQKGHFQVLHLEGNEEAKVTISVSDIEVMQGNRLYVFNLKKGAWSNGIEVYVPPSRATGKRAAPSDAQKPSR